MAYSEVEIVPVLDVEIRNCSQSVTLSAGIFPWMCVILDESWNLVGVRIMAKNRKLEPVKFWAGSIVYRLGINRDKMIKKAASYLQGGSDYEREISTIVRNCSCHFKLSISEQQ
jgi:hypothetical protein